VPRSGIGLNELLGGGRAIIRTHIRDHHGERAP
jgi:hypothetical protein